MRRAAVSPLSHAHAGEHTVFGRPLKEALRYASVHISTANPSGQLYIWGYIPVVVAKWSVCFSASGMPSLLTITCHSGLFLKENGQFVARVHCQVNTATHDVTFGQQPKSKARFA